MAPLDIRTCLGMQRAKKKEELDKGWSICRGLLIKSKTWVKILRCNLEEKACSCGRPAPNPRWRILVQWEWTSSVWGRQKERGRPAELQFYEEGCSKPEHWCKESFCRGMSPKGTPNHRAEQSELWDMRLGTGRTKIRWGNVLSFQSCKWNLKLWANKSEFTQP